MMIKIIPSYTILVALLIIISGCDLKLSETSFSTADKQHTPPASIPRYHISWTMHLNLPVPEDAEMVKYLEERLNVDLNIWNIENNRYEALLDKKLAEGLIPDLFRVRQPQDLLSYHQQELLAEIPEEKLKKYAPNIVKALEAYAPRYQDEGVIDGKYYGIPVINPTNIYRIPVVYRQDWLDKLGLSVPTTLEEFERVIYAFANEDPDGNGLKDTYGLSRQGMNVLFGAYGQIVFADQLYFGRKDDQLIIGALEPEMKDALRYLRKWYEDGVIDPEFVIGENKGGYKHLSHAFIDGRIGMTSMGNYYHWIQYGDYRTWNTYGEETPVEAAFNAKELHIKNPQAKIVFGQPFSGPNGKRGSQAYDMLMSFTAIGADAAKEVGKMEAILQILDYVSANPDPNEYTSMIYGVEGKHWSWVNKEQEEAIVLPPYDKMFGYQNMIGANLGMTVPFKPKSRREQWASTLGLDQDGIYNALKVATPSLTDKGTELIQMKDKAYISIITGEKPLNYFDSFVMEFMAAGGKEIVEEASKWYTKHSGD